MLPPPGIIKRQIETKVVLMNYLKGFNSPSQNKAHYLWFPCLWN